MHSKVRRSSVVNTARLARMKCRQLSRRSHWLYKVQPCAQHAPSYIVLCVERESRIIMPSKRCYAFFVLMAGGMPIYNSKSGDWINECYSNLTTAFGSGETPNRYLLRPSLWRQGGCRLHSDRVICHY